MEWKFNPMGDDESRDGSSLVEFFRSDVFKDFTDALVREDVQNRLDAKQEELDEGTPVRVRYFLSENSADSARLIDTWLKALQPHCDSKQCCEAYFRKPLQCFSQPLRYLTIECFNTTGLKGDPAECNENNESIKTNDFYWMFRNVGRSGKPRLKGKRGSWGIGKVVYHLASEANSIFCYSVSKDCFALMGKSQLEPHMIGDQMYRKVGYFADFDDKGFAMPVSDISNPQVKAFKADFGITRGNDDLGTSTVIPFCRKDVTVGKLVISAIRSYLWEILKGHVVIEIAANGTETIELTADVEKLNGYIEKYFPPDESDKKGEKKKFLAFNAFYAKIIASQKHQADIRKFALKDPGSYNNIFDYKPLFSSPAEFDEAKKCYQNGDFLEVEAAVTIGKRTDHGQESIPSRFSVYLQRGQVDGPQVSLIRDGLTILKLPAHRRTAFCALTLIEKPDDATDYPLSDFVRAAESPSHTDLKPSREAFGNVYTQGSVSLLKYIMDLMWELSAAFTDVAGTEDESAFDDYFSVEGDDWGSSDAGAGGTDDAAQEQPTKKKRRRRKKIKPVLPPIEHRRSFFRIVDQWNEGVKVVNSDTPAKPEDLPWMLQLKLAYAAEGVKAPLKKYDLSDFDCRSEDEASATIKANCTGCKVVKREPNRMVFEVASPEFALELTGFGTRRDVFVEARKIAGSEVIDGTPDEVSDEGEEDAE